MSVVARRRSFGKSSVCFVQAVKDVLALCESMGVKIVDDYAAELIPSKCGSKIVGVKTTGGLNLT